MTYENQEHKQTPDENLDNGTPDIAARIETADKALLAGNYAEAELVAREILSATGAENRTDKSHQSSALLVLGSCARLQRNFDVAVEHLNAALRASEELSDKESIVKALYELGVVHRQLSNYTTSLKSFERALSIAEEIGDKVSEARFLGNIGILLTDLFDYPKALEFHTRTLRIFEELGDKERIAKALDHIGTMHMYVSDYQKALEYFTHALKVGEELGNKAVVAVQLCNVGLANLHLAEFQVALQYLAKALTLVEELGNKGQLARILTNIGRVHFDLAEYSLALEYTSKALSLHEEVFDNVGIASNLSNIGLVYWRLSNFTSALEYLTKALRLYEEMVDKKGIAKQLGNIGLVHRELSNYASALEYHSKALSLHVELGNKEGEAINLNNIGAVLQEQGDFDGALEYYSRALLLFEELGLKSSAAPSKVSIGGLYAKAEWSGNDDAKAESYLLESVALSQELGTKIYEAHRILAELYERQDRWKESKIEFKKFYDLEKEVHSQEARKSAELMEQRRHILDREREMAIAKAAADAQMSATTTLLYKVLPQSVATRMIEGEEEVADYFPQVSILFADIAGFTPISADMPAIIVVRFLNYVFGEFDRIIKKHGCEKIKTIGDGYMAVCGAPLACEDHAERLATAALEMQETIMLPESIREYMPSGVKLGVRIGLHTGSVVAGVIGEERFVYDIYSDAVNTAARMESHGEENKIHVSNDFFRHLQNRFAITKNTIHGFVFEKRGEMEIKGKGMMRTYFLERA